MATSTLFGTKAIQAILTNKKSWADSQTHAACRALRTQAGEHNRTTRAIRGTRNESSSQASPRSCSLCSAAVSDSDESDSDVPDFVSTAAPTQQKQKAVVAEPTVVAAVTPAPASPVVAPAVPAVSVAAPIAAPVPVAAAAPAPAPVSAAPKVNPWTAKCNPIAAKASSTASTSASAHTPVAVAASAHTPASAVTAAAPKPATLARAKSTTAAPAASPALVKSSSVATPATAAPKTVLPTISSWGELTASFSNKTAAAVVAAPKPQTQSQLPAGLMEDEESLDVVPALSAPPAAANNASTSSSVAFDPELDSSRMGLPALFSSMSKTPAASSAASGVTSMNVVEEEEQGKSRQGTKRKTIEDAADETEAAAAPVDMQQLVASFKPSVPAPAPAPTTAAIPVIAPMIKIAWNGAGLQKPATSTVTAPKKAVATAASAKAAAASAAAATKISTQTPSAPEGQTGKKQRRNDGSSKATGASSVSTRPTSFLGAVTGLASTVAPAAAATPASPSSSSVSGLDDESDHFLNLTPAQIATRVASRQKQIDLGKRTAGYAAYIAAVPLESRLPSHPRTPDVHKGWSKRTMDVQIRTWRKLLHAFDPDAETPAPAPSASASVAASSAAPLGDEEGEMVDRSEASSVSGDFVIVGQ